VDSDFEVIANVLKKFPNTTAREIVKNVVSFQVTNSEIRKVTWDKGTVNSILYKMLAQGLVSKELKDGPRPYWNLSSGPAKPIQQQKISLATKKSGNSEFIPLVEINDYRQQIQGKLVQIALNDSATQNDLYMSCDWLDERIFIAINPNHPYIKSLVSSDGILREFLRFISIDAYCEWRLMVADKTINFVSIIEIKDKTLRDF
jgi:hypothetical protein